jgi:hypothetical protein
MGMFVGSSYEDEDGADYSKWSSYSEPEPANSKWDKYQKDDFDDKSLFSRTEESPNEA